MRERRAWRRCASCFGVTHWADTHWVCDACGDEWDETFDRKYRAPGEEAK